MNLTRDAMHTSTVRTVAADFAFFDRRPDRTFRVRLASAAESALIRRKAGTSFQPAPSRRLIVGVHIVRDWLFVAWGTADADAAADLDALDEASAGAMADAMLGQGRMLWARCFGVPPDARRGLAG